MQPNLVNKQSHMHTPMGTGLAHCMHYLCQNVPVHA